MAAGDGQIQGLFFHTLAGQLRKELSAADLARVIETFEAGRGPAAFARVEQMRRLGWASTGEYVDLVKASWDVLGAERYQAFWRQTGHSFVEGSLGTVFKGFQTAFGLGPDASLRGMPVVWGMATRDSGRFEFAGGDGPGHARLLFEAPALLLQDFFLQGLARGFESLLDLAGVQGSIQAEPRGEGRVSFEMRWTPRK